MKERCPGEGISTGGSSEISAKLQATIRLPSGKGPAVGKGPGGRGQRCGIFHGIKRDLGLHSVGSQVPSKGFKQKRGGQTTHPWC